MTKAEQGPGDSQRSPAPRKIFGPAKKDSAEQQLFHEGCPDHHSGQILDELPRVARTDDPIHSNSAALATTAQKRTEPIRYPRSRPFGAAAAFKSSRGR